MEVSGPQTFDNKKEQYKQYSDTGGLTSKDQIISSVYTM